ncbi:MAG: hypothetical protein AB7D40_09690 [Bacteroidales bacterium]
MKTRELIALILKIAGGVLIFKSVWSGGFLLGGFGLAQGIFHQEFPFSFFTLGLSALSMVFRVILPLGIGLFLLFRTETILRLMKVEEIETTSSTTITEPVEQSGEVQAGASETKPKPYRLIVLAFGLMVFLHGASNVYTYEIHTDTRIEQPDYRFDPQGQTFNDVNKTVHRSTSSNFNLIALLEMLVGLYLLVQSSKVAQRVQKHIEPKNHE